MSTNIPVAIKAAEKARCAAMLENDNGALSALLEQAQAGGWVLTLLKLGHRWGWIRPLLERRGLLAAAVFARRIGWPDERLGPAADLPAGEEPYFSLLLIRQGRPPVLPD